MLINKNEYIVKVKKAKIQIYGSKNDKKDVISFYIIWISTATLCTFIRPLTSMFFCLFMIIGAGLVVILNDKWQLKIEDEKIYIKKSLRNYIIDYSDLINVKMITVNSIDHGTERHHLKIEYMKKNSYKVIYLPYSKKNMESTILEVCNLFITNRFLEKYPNIGEDYIDIKCK